jgi:hypothetical protein
MQIDREEITRLTEEYCGVWGLNHARRLLQLIAVIGEGLRYDADALWAGVRTRRRRAGM